MRAAGLVRGVQARRERGMGQRGARPARLRDVRAVAPGRLLSKVARDYVAVAHLVVTHIQTLNRVRDRRIEDRVGLSPTCRGCGARVGPGLSLREAAPRNVGVVDRMTADFDPRVS